MHKFVALLRAVNVGGTSKAPSAALKAAAEGIGLQAVQPVLQTGNLVFEADAAPDALEKRLEQAFRDQLGLTTEVMVRTAPEWSAIVAANPFPGEAKSDPSHLLLMVMKREPRRGAGSSTSSIRRASAAPSSTALPAGRSSAASARAATGTPC